MAKSNFGVIIVWLKSGGLLKKIRNTYLLALRMIFYAALVSYAAMNYYILSGGSIRIRLRRHLQLRCSGLLGLGRM